MQRTYNDIKIQDITFINKKLQHTPDIIKSPYLQLVSLLDADEIYGSLLKIKDIFELNLKIPLIILLSYINQKISNSNDNTDLSTEFSALHEILQKFMKDALTYQLSLGHWQTISGAIKRVKYSQLFNEPTASNILVTLYEINAHNFEIYTSIKENGHSSSLAAWRNKTIGHGALNCNKDDVKIDVIEKLDLLNDLLLYNEKYYSNVYIEMLNNDIIIKSLKDSTSIVITPFADINAYNNIQEQNISIFDSYNNKKKLAHKINYATGEKDTSKTLSSRLSQIDDSLKSIKILSIINKTQSGTLNNSTIYKDDIEILNALHSNTYSQGSFFSDWFISCLDSYSSGVFLCCAERGMGKSAFSRAVNQLNTVKIHDNPALSNYLKSNEPKLLIRTFNFNSYYNSNIITFFTKLKDIFISELVVDSDDEAHARPITYISHEIEDAFDKIKNAIKDDEIPAKDKKRLFIDFLSTILSIWQDRTPKEKLVLILDGIDEIKNDGSNLNISHWIPTKTEFDEEGIDNIYIILTSRSSAELSNNQNIASYIKYSPFTDSLNLMRELPLDSTNIKSKYSICYLKDIKRSFKTANDADALSLANSLEWRYNYFYAYNKLHFITKETNLADFIKKPLEIYLKYLEQLNKSYVQEVKSMVNLLALTNEPLTINEISYLLTGDSVPNFKLYGMLMDISNFLTIEKDANRGTLYNLSHEEWLISINTSPYFEKSRNQLVNALRQKYILAIDTINTAFEPTLQDYDGETWLLCNLEILEITDFKALLPIISDILSDEYHYQSHRQLNLARYIVKNLQKKVTQLQDSQLLYIYIMCQHYIAERSIKSRAKSIYNQCVDLCEKYKNNTDDFLSIMNIIHSYRKRCNFLRFIDSSATLKDIDIALDIINNAIQSIPNLITKLELIDDKISLQKHKSDLLVLSDGKDSLMLLDSSIETLSYYVNYLKQYDSVDYLNNFKNNPKLFRDTWIKCFTNKQSNGLTNDNGSQLTKSILSYYYYHFLMILAETHKERSNKTSSYSDINQRIYHCESCIKILEGLHEQECSLVSDLDLAAAYIEMGTTYKTENLDTSIMAYSKAIDILESKFKGDIINNVYDTLNAIHLMSAYFSRGSLFKGIDDSKMKNDLEKAYNFSSSILSTLKNIHGYMKPVLSKVYLPIHLSICLALFNDVDKSNKVLEKFLASITKIEHLIFNTDIDTLFNLLSELSMLLEDAYVKNNTKLQSKLSNFILNMSTKLLATKVFNNDSHHKRVLAHTHIIRADVFNSSNIKEKLADYEASIKILNTLPDNSHDKLELCKKLKSSAIKSNVYNLLCNRFNLNP